MNLDIYSFSGVGNRSINEDSYDVRKENDRCIMVLCDGLGGHDCGEVASGYVAEQTAKGLGVLTEISKDSIHALVDAVNDKIVEMQPKKPEWNGMRTTLVGCVFENEKMSYFNSGDSRFYYFRNGSLYKMTTDHSASQVALKMGDIDDIRKADNRNMLFKVIGNENPNRSHMSDVYEPIDCQPGDAFLLCSDGFWEYVYEDEMAIDLSKSDTGEDWVKFMLVRLLLRMTGDNDNYTVIGGIIK